MRLSVTSANDNPSAALFERARLWAEQVTGIDALALGDISLPWTSLTLPVLISNAWSFFPATEEGEGENKVKGPSTAETAINVFGTKFANSELRRSRGRAERPLKPEVRSSAWSALHKIFNPFNMLAGEKMQAEMHPAAFGLKQGTVTVSVEKGRSPTLRLHTKGLRTMVLIKESDVTKSMKKKGMNPTPDNTVDFVKDITKDLVDELHNDGIKFHTCSLGARDGLLIPFGWIFGEKVGASEDVLGLRVSFWLSDDEPSMVEAHRWLTISRKQSQHLESACAGLAEMQAD